MKLKQWFFRITAFKEALLKDLDSLAGGWPERVLSMQRNWLGRSTGAKIKFPVTVDGPEKSELDVEVFTTRPDTLYGVEYLALSLDHPVVVKAAEKAFERASQSQKPDFVFVLGSTRSDEVLFRWANALGAEGKVQDAVTVTVGTHPTEAKAALTGDATITDALASMNLANGVCDAAE